MQLLDWLNSFPLCLPDYLHHKYFHIGSSCSLLSGLFPWAITVVHEERALTFSLLTSVFTAFLPSSTCGSPRTSGTWVSPCLNQTSHPVTSCSSLIANVEQDRRAPRYSFAPLFPVPIKHEKYALCRYLKDSTNKGVQGCIFIFSNAN